MSLASIITFSLFLKNIYKNMDERRRTEIEFRRRRSITEATMQKEMQGIAFSFLINIKII